MTVARMYRRAVKKAGVRKIGRKIYKATGLVNPIKKGRVSISRLATDVAKMQRMINAEKKQSPDVILTNQVVGQTNGNGGYGHQIWDITPQISQGVTGTTRNGVSIKLHSMCIRGQILQQSANHYQGKLKFQFFINKGNVTTPSISELYQLNPINSLYDTNSIRALDTFKGYSLLCTRWYSLKQDNYSGVQGWRDFVIPLKFKNFHIKYNDDNSTNATNGQIILVITADGGNSSSTTASLSTTIPVTAINTGYNVNISFKSWFYDN